MRHLRLVLLLLLALALGAVPAWGALSATEPRRTYTGTASDAAWLKITLASGARCVIVQVVDAAYIDGPEAGYTDGAARSSGGLLIPAAGSLTLPLPAGTTQRSIYAAGAGASSSITVMSFQSECEP